MQCSTCAFSPTSSTICPSLDAKSLISQAETERILREAVGRHGVAIEHGVELVGLSQDALSHDPSPVQAMLRHADGRLEQAQAPWLISAEGAHSAVRTTLDLQFEGKTLDEQYALGDLHIAGDLPETDFHIFSSPHGFMGLFPMGGRRFRLIASNPISRPEKGTEPSLAELQGIYDQRSRIPARFHDMTWSSWFRIIGLLLSGFEREVVAIDGKTIRCSFEHGREQSPLHVVSAWASEQGLVLGQRCVDGKSNEITAVPELLDQLALQNTIVTLDAMGEAGQGCACAAGGKPAEGARRRLPRRSWHVGATTCWRSRATTSWPTRPWSSISTSTASAVAHPTGPIATRSTTRMAAWSAAGCSPARTPPPWMP